jgi:DNA invertase Pin-like site-specific DNA recombinase
MNRNQNTTTPTQAIAYYRVSTQKQGRSGLGLEAQRTTVQNYCAANHLSIIAEYTEVESGRHNKRVQLALALAESKRIGSRLVIAKLDRLSRSASFTMALKDAHVDFVACDYPDMGTLMIGIIASMNQNEAEKTSERTRDALAAAKRRGVKLGNPEHLTPAAMAKGRAMNRQMAIDAYSKLTSYIGMLRAEGMGYLAIAKRLNADGYVTRNGKQFTASTIFRMIARA